VLLCEIQKSIPPMPTVPSDDLKPSFVDLVTRQNVIRTIGVIREQSRTLDRLIQGGEVAIIGGIYDVTTGAVEFLSVGPAAGASH
jgi:carbonic anhydrase